MKQTIRIAVVLLVAVAFSLGWGLVTSTDKNEKEKLSLMQKNRQLAEVISQKESEFNDIMYTITEVEDHIKQIVEKENLVYNHNLEGIEASKQEQIMQEIEMIDELVIRTKATVSSLEDKLKAANFKTNVFKNRLSNLNAQLKEREVTIASLKATVDARDESIRLINVQVDSLVGTASEQLETIQAKNTEIKGLTEENNLLNRAYLAIGSFRDLKDRGLVQRQGGFLWFGRTIDVVEDAGRGKFLEVDIRQVNYLPVKAANLSLLSEHPIDSYEIVPGETEEMKILEITDPEEFWKASRYLVISKKT